MKPNGTLEIELTNQLLVKAVKTKKPDQEGKLDQVSAVAERLVFNHLNESTYLGGGWNEYL